MECCCSAIFFIILNDRSVRSRGAVCEFDKRFLSRSTHLGYICGFVYRKSAPRINCPSPRRARSPTRLNISQKFLAGWFLPSFFFGGSQTARWSTKLGECVRFVASEIHHIYDFSFGGPRVLHPKIVQVVVGINTFFGCIFFCKSLRSRPPPRVIPPPPNNHLLIVFPQKYEKRETTWHQRRRQLSHPSIFCAVWLFAVCVLSPRCRIVVVVVVVSKRRLGFFSAWHFPATELYIVPCPIHTRLGGRSADFVYATRLATDPNSNRIAQPPQKKLYNLSHTNAESRPFFVVGFW